MSFKLRSIIYTDLIGKKVYAKHKWNPLWNDFKELGKVIDETKNTLKVLKKHGGKPKTYIKPHYIFRMWVRIDPHESILIEFDGVNIMGSPAERLKKLKKIRRKLH